MELFAIKERLKEYETNSLGNPDLNMDIRLIKLLEPDQTRFHNHIIYLGDTSNLPAPDTKVFSPSSVTEKHQNPFMKILPSVFFISMVSQIPVRYLIPYRIHC
jgi:hypothetical protein